MTDTTREGVERYAEPDKSGVLWKDPDGFWVKHSDYAALLTRAEATEARERLLLASNDKDRTYLSELNSVKLACKIERRAKKEARAERDARAAKLALAVEAAIKTCLSAIPDHGTYTPDEAAIQDAETAAIYACCDAIRAQLTADTPKEEI